MTQFAVPVSDTYHTFKVIWNTAENVAHHHLKPYRDTQSEIQHNKNNKQVLLSIIPKVFNILFFISVYKSGVCINLVLLGFGRQI